jgi:putative transposase
MARKPHFNIPSIPQHVIQRGNNRDPCFFSGQDCSFYLESLQVASEESCCAIDAWVLMTNQYRHNALWKGVGLIEMVAGLLPG